MSTVYGSPGYSGLSGPPRRVNYGWIGESWNLFSANAGVWILAVIVGGLVPFLVSFILGFAVGASGGAITPAPGTSPFASMLSGGGSPPWITWVSIIFGVLWRAFFYGGVYRMAVKQVRGEPISAGDIFSGGPLFLKMLGFEIIYGLSVFIGSLLIILPGLLIAGLLLPAFALIADGDGLAPAISRSIDAMKADLWNAAGFVFVLFLLITLSVFACGLGTFVTIPMSFIISALAYRDMVGMPNMVAPAGPIYGAPQAGVWPPPPQPGAPPQSGTIYGQNPNPPPAFGQGPTTPPAFGQTQAPPPAAQQTPPPANPFAPQAAPPPAANPFAPPPNPPRTSLFGEPLDEDKTDKAG